jgi:hypothetical protein
MMTFSLANNRISPRIGSVRIFFLLFADLAWATFFLGVLVWTAAACNLILGFFFSFVRLKGNHLFGLFSFIRLVCA